MEGNDGAGRSTQIKMLRRWLESEGYAVSDTGLTRSTLTAKGIEEAKSGHTLGPLTLSLFYLADFADRLETRSSLHYKPALLCFRIAIFIPSLHAMPTAGVDKEWSRKLYGIAL